MQVDHYTEHDRVRLIRLAVTYMSAANYPIVYVCDRHAVLGAPCKMHGEYVKDWLHAIPLLDLVHLVERLERIWED